MLKLLMLTAVATGVAFVNPANAFVLGRTNTSLQAFGNGVFIVAQSPGIFVSSFVLATPSNIAITYSAECAASGINGYVTIDVVVDGIVRAPTVGLSDRFCSSDHTLALDNAGYTSLTVPVSLGAGLHTVQIRAQTIGGGVVGNLDDTSLVVQD